jgi:UDP-2-acetamido-3-amino-2,3-dideoxy-glucuronate N-acetyltransferase
MTHIRVAVIGTGYWGKNLVRVFSEIGNLGAICDSNIDNAKPLSEKYDVPILSFEEVIDNKEIQGVVIAAPAVMHYEIAKKALLAGKHVFVEKPLSLHVEHATELCKLAKRFKLILMVGHILQYHPIFLKCKEMIAEGQIGRLRYVYTNRLNLGKIRREEDILWSFAPHDLSMILSIAGEEPSDVQSVGAYFLSDTIADNTITNLTFPSGVKGHIFVSWLHPYKEQKAVIVGDKGMMVFNDCNAWDEKLTLYPHIVSWQEGMPLPEKADGINIQVGYKEPLQNECSAFIDAIDTNVSPISDGEEGLRVLKVLKVASHSLLENKHKDSANVSVLQSYKKHESAFVDDDVKVGAGTKIWHFSHILEKSVIGENCVISQNVMIGPDVKVGDNCKIQNNVSLYRGVELEDGVFCGPSCVFTNVNNPRAEVERKDQFRKTLVKKGTTIGANATIVCGVTLGEYCFIGAGAVVTKNVPPHALVVGNPARQIGWMSKSGERLTDELVCPRDGVKYILKKEDELVVAE